MTDYLLIALLLLIFGREVKLNGCTDTKDVRPAMHATSRPARSASRISDSTVSPGSGSPDNALVQDIPFDVFCERIIALDSPILETLERKSRDARKSLPTMQQSDARQHRLQVAEVKSRESGDGSM